MIGLAWYAPLGGALILGAIVFGLAKVQQWRFVKRYEREEAGDKAAQAPGRPHHA